MKRKFLFLIICVTLVLLQFFSGCKLSTNNTDNKNQQSSNASNTTTSENDEREYSTDLILDSRKIPLTLQAITSGNIILSGRNAFEKIEIQRGDGLIIEAADNIFVHSGDIIHFYGKKYKYKDTGTINLTIDCSADCYVYGNVMSLIEYTDFCDKEEIVDDFIFQKLFKNNTHIKNHETLDIILPATILSNYCYKEMFYGCTSLTKAPELPAVLLTTECYNSMFYECCNLNTIECFASDISGVDCTKNWIYKVASSGMFISKQESNIWRYKDRYSGIPLGWEADPPYSVVNAKELPLTLEAIEDGSIVLTKAGAFYNLQYSKNDEVKIPVTAIIEVCKGDKICFYADGPIDENMDSLRINCTSDCYIYGNIMSLISSEQFADKTILSKNCSFAQLFLDNTHIKNLSIELLLPAISLTTSCYNKMFYGCTGLTFAPELPATSLADSCYSSMFYGCSGLTWTPDLPATSISPFCYSNMFYGCTGLTTASLLPSVSLKKNCYFRMFEGCTNLTTAPSLPATNLAYECYAYMFLNCTSLTSAPELPATSLSSYCYYNMFNGCTDLTSVPKLPATSLTEHCYSYMFNGCTSLTSAPELPATSLATGCYSYMFKDCTSLLSAPNLPATTLSTSCYNNMFNGCNNLVSAPILPATTLTNACYANMFRGCLKLYSIECLATDNSANNCTYDWLDSVSNPRFLFCPNPNIWTSLPDGWSAETDFPLTLEAIQGGTISITNPNEFTDLQYSINYNTKKSYTNPITIYPGDTVFFFANGPANSDATSMTINSSSDCYIYGNVMSLISPNHYSNEKSISIPSTFKYLFYENTHIKNHPSKAILLPATSTSALCYSYMFYGCTGLTSTPKINAISMAPYCCSRMFSGCINLISSYDLLATSLADSCCEYMFKGCTSLTSAPKLPATSLVANCYYNMFQDCTSLTSTPKLPATSLARNCYLGMFSGCTSLITTSTLPATTLDRSCYSRMFSGCTSLTSAPNLPATTLEESCYSYMFYGCTNLQSTPKLSATTLKKSCYSSMFYGCLSLNYVQCLAKDISADNCTNEWLIDVASEGTFIKSSQMNTWQIDSASGIPAGWTVSNAS